LNNQPVNLDSLPCRRCGVKVVVVGVDELVVIASPQGVFVAPRSRASEVKDIIGD